jgi:hypothetical protein
MEWEYRQAVDRSGYGLSDASLAQFGKEGWELVSTVRYERIGVTYIFKRPRQQNAEGRERITE